MPRMGIVLILNQVDMALNQYPSSEAPALNLWYFGTQIKLHNWPISSVGWTKGARSSAGVKQHSSIDISGAVYICWLPGSRHTSHIPFGISFFTIAARWGSCPSLSSEQMKWSWNPGRCPSSSNYSFLGAELAFLSAERHLPSCCPLI